MMQKPRRAMALGTLAVVLGLHLSVAWLLLANSRFLTRRTESPALELVFIARPPSAMPSDSTRQAREARDAREARESAAPHRRAEGNPLPVLHAAPPRAAENAIQPPTDWNGELSREARDAASTLRAQKPRDFGFPSSPSANPAKRPEFAWDYAATHRLEAIPDGGLLVHLNDRCVLVLSPLPFAGCAIGKRKADGTLFDHMNDVSRNDRDDQSH